jgi:hypothetical protein
LEGDGRDDAKTAKGEKGAAEKLSVFVSGAGDELAVGEEDGQAGDGVGEEAMGEGRAVGARRDGASDRLDIDGAKVGKGEVVLGQVGIEFVQ